MLSHDQARRKLSAYIDAELGDAERAELAAHLAACEPCRAEARDYRGLGKALFQPLPAGGERFVRGVMARLPLPETSAWPAWLGGPLWGPSLGLALAAAALAFALRRESPIGTEALLVASAGGSEAEWAMASAGHRADDLLSMSMEEP